MFVASNTIDAGRLWQYRDSAVPAQSLGYPDLFSIGHLNPNKDFVGLLKSFLLFRANFSKAALRTLGDGPYCARMEATAGNKLGKSVFLICALRQAILRWRWICGTRAPNGAQR